MTQALFGLPEDVVFCRECVISNQRPSSAIEFHHRRNSVKETIAFGPDGVCEACCLADEKGKTIDWDQREVELIELAAKHKADPGQYNCLVPGSGGKDSFFQAHILKYKYGFRPLTITWSPHLYTEWGWRNHQSWISAGFDNYLISPNRQVHRLLTRLAVENLLHPFQPFILGQKLLAPKFAAMTGIKLVFYGENEAEYGNPSRDAESAQRDSKFFSSGDDDEVVISGVPLSELHGRYHINPHELSQYLPSNHEALSNSGVQVHYLGYYLRWHPQAAYYYAVENGGFEPSPERTPGTYSKYNSIDDKLDDLHYFTTFIKFGIGRATYDAAQEIRNGEITREEAVALVRRFDGEWPARFEQELMEYLSIDPRLGSQVINEFEEPRMSKEYFLSHCDGFRSPHLWSHEDGVWRLRHQVS